MLIPGGLRSQIFLSVCALVAWIYRRFPWLMVAYRRRRINPRELCLACGFAGRKDLRFDPIEKVVIIQCPQCQACWSRAPLVNASVWAKPIAEE